MSVTVSIRKQLRGFCLETDFETSQGCLGILGASGSGKSMTLKCIAGIETPDEGYIAVNGRVFFDSGKKKINLKPQVRRTGYLFQSYALFPKMTVLENLTAGLSCSKPEKRAKALDWLERFELHGLEERYPHQLSGGQQQRTALARMLIHEPELILLDEPFSALDTNLREQMQLRFEALLESRNDVILVTHSRDEVYRLCNELVVMEAGRVLNQGKTRELFHNPGTVHTARITGCKNISPIKRLGEQEVYALNWGLRLRLSVPVEPEVTHIGIRAHDFLPVQEGEGYNRVRISIIQRSEEPFEGILLFTNAGADIEAELQKLWWKYSPSLVRSLPEQLFIPPESVLPLRG